MNILHITPIMDPKMGGVCQAVRTMIAGLREVGVDNEVVSLDEPNASFLHNDSFVIHPHGPAKGPWSYSKTLYGWLVDKMSRFDAIIVHGLWLYYGYAAVKAFKQLKTQTIAGTEANHKETHFFIMPHGMLDPYFQIAAKRRLKAIRNWVYWKIIEKSAISESNGLLFTCSEERRLAGESLKPYNPASELVVGLGVEEPPAYTTEMRDAFFRKCPELVDSKFLLFLSRIDDKKGVDLLIKAYNKLSNSSMLLPRLVIAGPGMKSIYGQSMKKLAAQSTRSADNISFLDMLTGDAKWGAFYNCEAFVLPSHQENYGIAVVEALACKKPVLITKQVNIWQEIILSGGGLAESDTIEGVQQVIRSWCNKSDQQKSVMSQAAYYAYKTYFSVSAATTNLLTALSRN